jgi:hypothetical protein
MTTNLPEPLLALTNVNTFYGQAQVHFDLSITVRARATSSACSAAMPAASRRR